MTYGKGSHSAARSGKPRAPVAPMNMKVGRRVRRGCGGKKSQGDMLEIEQEVGHFQPKELFLGGGGGNCTVLAISFCGFCPIRSGCLRQIGDTTLNSFGVDAV